MKEPHIVAQTRDHLADSKSLEEHWGLDASRWSKKDHGVGKYTGFEEPHEPPSLREAFSAQRSTIARLVEVGWIDGQRHMRWTIGTTKRVHLDDAALIMI